MSTISSYILRHTIAPLLVAVAIALLVLLTERMLRLLDLVLDTGGGLVTRAGPGPVGKRTTWRWPCRRPSSSA